MVWMFYYKNDTTHDKLLMVWMFYYKNDATHDRLLMVLDVLL